MAYVPALDGLFKAVAVLAVIAYHLDFGWAQGGYLGVDLFFVLSGYLITSLLVGEWVVSGGIGFRSFWARRARRLLPAVVLLLLVLALYAGLGGPGLDRSALRPDALATLFYSANWHQVFAHQSYFAQFASASPLRHTWSLAIEEQFYLIWPLILLGLLVAARGRRVVLLVATGLLAAGSAALMAVLYHPGIDPSRVYYVTDTRAFELVVGAALAIALACRRPPGSPAPLKALQVGLTVALATASYYLVERPVRRAAFSGWKRRSVAPVGVAATAAALVVATVPAANPISSLAAGAAATSGSGLPAAVARAAPDPAPSLAAAVPPELSSAMVVGDSTAITLAEGLKGPGVSAGLVIHDGGRFACTIIRGYSGDNASGSSKADFHYSPNCDWQTKWPPQLGQWCPKVVLVLFGPLDTADHLLNGRWLRVGTPEWQSYYQDQLTAMVKLLSSQGAQVVIAPTGPDPEVRRTYPVGPGHSLRDGRALT